MKLNIERKEDGNWDLSFLDRRKCWLPNTGLYLNFDEDVLISNFGGVIVSQYSDHKFFVNIESSGDISILTKDKPCAKYHFDVVELNTNFALFIPNLLSLNIPYVRNIANTLSENCINQVRTVLFTPEFLSTVSNYNFELDDEFMKYFDVAFSILTERGLNVHLTVFDENTLYTRDVLDKLRRFCRVFILKYRKFGLIWDFVSNIPTKSSALLMEALSDCLLGIKILTPEDVALGIYNVSLFADSDLLDVVVRTNIDFSTPSLKAEKSFIKSLLKDTSVEIYVDSFSSYRLFDFINTGIEIYRDCR